MRFLPSILLAVLALGLGTLVLLQKQQGNLDSIFGAPALGVGDQIYEFDPREVGRIEILNSDGTQAIVKKVGGAWFTDSPWKDLAEPALVQSIIEFSSQLIIEDVVETDDVEDLAEFGLRSAKIEIQLYDTGGRPLCHFNIGRYTAWRTIVEDEEAGPRSVGVDAAPGKSSFPTVVIWPSEENNRDYIYVCGDRINAALRRIPIRSLFQDELKLLRNHSVFYRPPHFAAEIIFRDQDSEIILKRDSLGKNDKWRLTKPFDLAANSKVVQSLIAQLSTLKASAVLDESSEALSEPLLENVAKTVEVKFFLPDGSVSGSTTVSIYPPENAADPIVSAVIQNSPKQKRPAILKLNRADLAKLPDNVNDLRSRTMTSLQIAQIAGLEIEDDVDRKVKLSLKFDPHERAKRWHAITGDQEGAANEEQVKALFETLFVDEVIAFSDDAAADFKFYGLDRPLRKVRLSLTDQSTVEFTLGQAFRDHFYARNRKTGRVMEVTKAAYDALINDRPSPELDTILRAPANPQNPDYNLKLYGLDRPIQKRFRAGEGAVYIDFGRARNLHFYANRTGTPRVAEVSASALNKMAMRSFKWRARRLWNIDPFEIRGLLVQAQGKPPLQLSYNFFRQEWKARLDGLDTTAQLNENKASRLLEKLTDIRVTTWLGPIDDNAAFELSDPDFTISVITEVTNDEGKSDSLKTTELKVAKINDRLYYGKLSNEPSYFILDAGVVKGLQVKLLQ